MTSQMPGGRPLPALITGASTGIGADLARIFARNGHPVALVARSGDRLAGLAEELKRDHGATVHVMALDLERAGASKDLAGRLADSGFRPGILVNNAGYGDWGRFAEQDQRNQLGIVDLNCRMLTEMTGTFLPDLIAAKGRILNVASLAGFYPGPGAAVYYASKAYVLSLSRALNHELKAKGVTVTALCPGPVKTEFFERAAGGGNPFRGMRMMASMPVAEAGYRGVMAGKREVVPGVQNWIMAKISGLSPLFIALPFVAAIQMRRRAKQ